MMFRYCASIFGYLPAFVLFCFILFCFVLFCFVLFCLDRLFCLALSVEVTQGVAKGCNRQGTLRIRGGEGCGSGGERA